MSDAQRFRSQIKGFLDRAADKKRRVFKGCAEQILYSIKFGSPLTGAPGQPVDTGYLKGSFVIVGDIDAIVATDSEWTAEIGTNCAYAPIYEYGGNRAAANPRGVVYPEPDLNGEAVEGVNPTRKKPRDAQSRMGPGVKSVVGGYYSVQKTRENFDRILTNVVKEIEHG